MSNGQSNPYVTQVTIVDGGKVMLTIQVKEFNAGDYIEVSGYAIQDGDAFATFYDIEEVEHAPDGSATLYIKARPSKEFKRGVPVTVVMRATRAWISVLTGPVGIPGKDPTATDGTVWDKVETVGQVSTARWPTGSNGQS